MAQAVSVTQYFGLEYLNRRERNKCTLLINSLLTNAVNVSEFNNSFNVGSNNLFDSLLDYKEFLMSKKELSYDDFFLLCEKVGIGRALNDYFLCALEEDEQQYLTKELKLDQCKFIFTKMSENIFMNPMKLVL